ncbi:MAG TPA: TetR/AcrR family transcriptional regulator [Solirubrobacteraceae bacterium]|nr:TetR/AcrR family transcriptional regulator [Solirubrobacteraceae bacterium]
MSGTERELSAMYRRLPHGPHGMGRDAVARHQRARLFGAMIEAVHRQGYKATTVAHVIALAGVSRRAFYEQFANKEDCFLGTYDIAVARAKRRMVDGWMNERGWANRMHRACQAFVEDASRNVKSSRLVLIEGLGLGAKSRERMMRSAVAFERVLADGFKVAPDGVQLPPLGPKAIVGGGRHLLFDRLRSDRVSELPALTDELLDWISAYRSPAARIGVARTPPPHRPVEPARFLESDEKRARVLGAVVHLTLDEGYHDLTDPQIAQFAGMSTESFHKHFPSKRECFLAVVDEFIDETIEAIAASTGRASTWQEAAYLGVKGGVDHLVAHPGLTKMAFVDVFDVGPAVTDSIGRSLGKLATMLQENSPEPRRAPLIAHEAVAGAVWAIVGSYAVRKRVKYLPSLIDHVAFLVLAPYVGPKMAGQTIDATRRSLARDEQI